MGLQNQPSPHGTWTYPNQQVSSKANLSKDARLPSLRLVFHFLLWYSYPLLSAVLMVHPSTHPLQNGLVKIMM
jgi:hypothetical protein